MIIHLILIIHGKTSCLEMHVLFDVLDEFKNVILQISWYVKITTNFISPELVL